MPTIRLLKEDELRSAVPLDLDAVDCVENAFWALGVGGVVMPPILSMAIHDFNGEVDVKTAYVPGLDSFALKISPGFFDNPKIGLPSTSGLMILFAVQTGQLEAVLLDNGYLTDVRTAAAGAVAARHLSRPDSEVAMIFGTGMQSRLQLSALNLVRPIKRAMIWGRDAEKARRLAGELTGSLDIVVEAVRDPASAVGSADIIVTTTPATDPIFKADWLQPGQHLTAMGSDQATKNEIEPGAIATATLYVADRLSQTRSLGELRAALDAGVTLNVAPPELGDILVGEHPGRTSNDDITIADLTGTGVQDTAIATFARERATANGQGTDFVS